MNYIEQMVAELCPRGVEFRELGEICQIQTGKLNANKAVPNGAYPFFTCSKDVSRIDSYRWDTEALLLAGNGYLGDVKHYCGKFDAYQRTYVLTGFSSEISPRFLYFILSNGFTEWAEKHQKEGSVPYIVLSVVQSFRIPLPPLPIQQEIVRVLDTFSQLVRELQANLQAELVARRKQYQYYRDQLLSFEGVRM
ncbi:MAG: restriction endonuclease subunit S [Chlorobi bacterium]|nr:restriction endonuclease subunit S [Chlorobiota bacterium]